MSSRSDNNILLRLISNWHVTLAKARHYIYICYNQWDAQNDYVGF